MPLVEAGIGVVLILGIAGMLALGLPAPDATDPQLDAYAADVATVLGEEPARHEGTTRLDEVSRSPAQFDREADALEDRVDDLLPDNILFRVTVQFHATDSDAQRTIGIERPTGAVTGTETVTTSHGQVHVEVWYP